MDELIGKSVFDLYTPKSAAYVKEKVFPLFLKRGKISEAEMQAVCKNGTIIDVSLNASAVRDKNGDILKTRSIWRNITAYKKIKDALRDTQNMLKLVLDSIPVSVFRKDGDLRYLGGNKTFLSDAGLGFIEDILPRIFDPFLTLKAKGSGLGLTTCYSIIKRHNGIIEVKSETGRGSTFEICLPASAEPAAPPSENRQVTHRGKGRERGIEYLYKRDGSSTLFQPGYT